ncbi:ComF family protein [Pectobacterium brasiliense]|uniref:ComF family protein n=1 Tax=Pectobacterium brasiliense TaxID=180957 RepID=UPI001F084E1B|nr:phosphoribosyltransferase [Pectobacterium brasiliense]
MVAIGKRIGHFNSELVRKMAVMIQHRWKPIPAPAWVCCVPSLHNSKLVPDFAQRLAKQLNLPFVDAIHKIRDNQPQKNQQNRFSPVSESGWCICCFAVSPRGPVLLVDDIIDSGWTLTVIAALLQQAGSGCVYPVALASSSVKDE